MKRIALLCGCLLAGLSAGAQVTLDECRRLAREHYPEIRQYDLVHRTEEYNILPHALNFILPRGAALPKEPKNAR